MGDEVKVWSHSGKTWCKGSVTEIRGAEEGKEEKPKEAKKAKEGDDPLSMLSGMGKEQLSFWGGAQ